jgi:GTPase SAR1 family protein
MGVVGATGAGKSSVINAMLDEERLVPTNCMRACTAVVTEISYNYEEGVPYRAEVEFISRSDWHKMLKILFQDLLDGTGQVSRECTNEDSECGIAYAQVKAVYPKLTKEEMEQCPIDRLMAHDNAKCLGTTRNLESDDSLVFYKKLQHYVDSKEKSTGQKDKGDKDKKKPREMEFWPLIRVVRLYVKAPALATGAVIVDLPGVHDSNQARAAVAQGYMKQCTGLWIVAPITRAVDDKSAKNLLGDSFKRQLKMDGGYDSVTFICSKTDDISITEAQDSLGLEEEFAPMWERSEDLRRRESKLKKEIADLKEAKSDMTAAMDSAEEELDVWEKLQEECSDGKAVFKPKPKSEKRKRVSKSTPPRKKSKYTEPGSDDDFIEDDDAAILTQPPTTGPLL